MFAEDVVEEVYAVIQETFPDHPDLSAALGLLDTVFGAGELVARREYRTEVAAWKRQLRDPTDAPLAAAAIAAETDPDPTSRFMSGLGIFSSSKKSCDIFSS